MQAEARDLVNRLKVASFLTCVAGPGITATQILNTVASRFEEIANTTEQADADGDLISVDNAEAAAGFAYLISEQLKEVTGRLRAAAEKLNKVADLDLDFDAGADKVNDDLEQRCKTFRQVGLAAVKLGEKRNNDLADQILFND